MLRTFLCRNLICFPRFIHSKSSPQTTNCSINHEFCVKTAMKIAFTLLCLRYILGMCVQCHKNHLQTVCRSIENLFDSIHLPSQKEATKYAEKVLVTLKHFQEKNHICRLFLERFGTRKNKIIRRKYES